MAEEATEGTKVNLKYKGASHYREVSAADFKSLGVEDQGKIRVAGESALVRNHDYDTPQVVEVSEDAADALLDIEPDDWEITEEPAEPPLQARATARRLARAQKKEERELAKSASESSGQGTGGADSGTAGETATAGGSSTAGGGSTGGTGRSTRSR